jgi:hypothetical protein
VATSFAKLVDPLVWARAADSNDTALSFSHGGVVDITTSDEKPEARSASKWTAQASYADQMWEEVWGRKRGGTATR